MTIIAGVISRIPAVAVPDSVCDDLKRGISRDLSDRAIEFRLGSAYLLKVDIGAFGAPAHCVAASGSVSVLAGEPLLLVGDAQDAGRDVQLRFMHDEWEQGLFDCVRSSSGTFCAAFYDPDRATGHLIADRLGLRPLYYGVAPDFVYFASALRVLEALDAWPKSLDVRALAEITGFGYPFGAGTPYAGIKMLLPCEVLSIRRHEVSSSRYFDWGSIQPREFSETDALVATYRTFRQAIRRRLRRDRTTFAYLSGGLDSRCVVAALRSEGVRTYTFNFSLKNTQDQVFALQYAQGCGAIHQELPTEPGPDWSAVMADAWAASSNRRVADAEHPQLVWTGEGGSVGLGHVYISPEIVEQLRAGDWDGAIATFLRQQSKKLLTRILKPEIAASMEGLLHSRLLAELLAIRQRDPVRSLYIFLNLNGPRRHLVNHFETIDQHRLEFQLPFYDSELLEHLTALPAEPFLYHRFYVKWLRHFDAGVLKVPWQAYPGHVRSPQAIAFDLPDQWNAKASKEHQAKLRKQLDARIKAMLSDSDFPHDILNRTALRIRRTAWSWGIANYDYALKAALTYFKYAKQAGGRFELL